MLLSLFLGGCSSEPRVVEDNLSEAKISDDNYRNYYEIFVRSFYDSNGDGFGDLNGVTKKLDYIRDLGYTGIWLMPINPSPSYHKYDVIDYYDVDKMYGSIDDLKNLIKECHKRDIKLILDLVLNHSSTQSPYFIKACNAYDKARRGQYLTEEDKKFKDFYSFFEYNDDAARYVTTHRAPGKDFLYECNFSDTMPEFNCASKEVEKEFENIIRYYMEMGVDGFRLDAVKYYFKDNTEKNIEFLNKIKKWATKYNDDAYIVGECWDSSDIITDYYKSSVDSFFNFSLSVTNSNNGIMNGINREGKNLNSYFNAIISNDNIVGDGNGIPAPFLNNHDTQRFTSASRPSRPKFQYACLQMLGGTTFTYYGDEVGMVGSNSGDLPDQNVRIPLKWGEASNKGDCKPLAGATESKYPYPSVSEQLEDKNSILNYYKQVLRVRNQNPEIARGKASLVTKDTKEDKVLFIAKEYNGSKIGIIFNFHPMNDLIIDYKKYGFNEVCGQIRVDTDKYIEIQRDSSIKMPAYSIAVVK